MFSKGSFLAFAIVTVLLATTANTCLAEFEYQDIMGVCQPCYYRCLTCQDSSTSCISCIPEYYLDLGSETCTPCIKGCGQCTTNSDCQLCNDGFFLNDNGTCSVCVVGASTCTISITSQCQATYYMLAGICARCLANCSNCTGPTTCDQCLSGFYLVSNTACLICGSNCAACNSSSLCLTCNVGYYPTSGQNSCSKCAGTGNIVYSVATATCISCPLFCQSCDSQACYYCASGYYLSSDSTSCISGGSILCTQSTGPTYTECKVDMYGCRNYSSQQYDTSSGSEVPVDVCLPKSFTSTSQFNYQTNLGYVCTSNITSFSFASDAFYSLRVYAQLFVFTPLPASVAMVIGNVTTVIALPTSLSSQPSTASSCGSYAIWTIQQVVSSYGRTVTFPVGTFLNEILVESLLCSVELCEKCTTNVDCLSCLAPYYLQFNKCLQQCDSGLYKYPTNRTCFIDCPNTTYPIRSQYLCSDCSGACRDCSTATSCLSCKQGYFLFGTACVVNCTLESNALQFSDISAALCRVCPFPCVSCASNTTLTTSYCLSCAVGYLYRGTCPLSCPSGTFPNFTDALKVVCSACATTSPSFCSSCTNQSTCTSCQSSFVLYGTTCVASCPPGYFNSSSTCVECLLPCLECISSSSNCTACKLGVLSVKSGFGYCPASTQQIDLDCPDGFYVNFLNNLNVTCMQCDSRCTLCYGTSSGNCLACSTGYFLDSTTCSNTCSLNSTFMDSSTNLCSACKLPCLTCQVSNGSACTSCVVGFLNQPACTLVCNSNFYPLLSGQLYVCTACPTSCTACYADLTAIQCTSCVSPYLLFSPNGTCILPVNCPAGYYNDTSNLKCPSCIDPCATCFNSGVKCLSCTSTTYLVSGLNYCVKQCSSGYYLLGNTCFQCSSPCSECSTTAANCTKCSVYNQVQYFLYGNACLVGCPALYYNEATNSTCQNCVDPCLDCYTQFYCKSCIDASLSLFNKACIVSCPIGTLSLVSSNGTKVCEICIQNCYTCSHIINNCTSCNANYYFYANASSNTNQCLSSCPTGLYGDPYTSICQPCVSPCLTCGSYAACKSCVANYSLFGSICLLECPKQYYPSSQVCTPCQSPCERCTSQTTCTLCVAGLYLPYNTTSGSCTNSCLVGQYADSFTRSCLICVFPCLNCSNASVCSQCGNGTSLYMQVCLSVCPNGYYSNGAVCNACPHGCSVCSSSTLCSNCTSGYVLTGGLCYETCPAATFQSANLVENVKICLSCSSNCLNCTSAYNCSACQTNYHLQDGLCTRNCSNFYYLSPNAGCLRCSANCLKCTNASYCLQCFSSFMYNHACILSCPTSAYPVLSNMTCQDCQSPCLTCSSQHTCLSCISNYFLYQSACIDRCTNQTWTMIDNRTCVADCPVYKYYPSKYCYSQCPRDMVGESDVCVEACGSNRYVSSARVCTQCTEQLCSSLFKADMKIIQSNPLSLVIYFNHRAEQLLSSDIVLWTGGVLTINSNSSRRLFNELSSPTSVQIDHRSVRIAFSDTASLDMTTIYLKIPFLASLESDQSLLSNSFNQTLSAYRNWQYQPNLSIVSNVMSYVVLAILLVNLWSASGNYQPTMDLAQLFFVLSYMQIEYPLVLSTFYQGFRPCVLGLRLSLAAPDIYSFSPSKFIQFDEDVNLLRNCGLTIILGVVVGVLFLVTVLTVRIKQEVSEGEATKLLVLLRKLHKRIFYRYLNDYLFLSIIWTGMFAVATFRNSPNSYTLVTYVVSVLVLITIISLVAYIFFVVLSALQQKKPNFAEIEGLVEDLQTDCSTLGLMHTPIIYLRKLLLIFLVGLYSTQPVYSLALLLILSILILVILIFYKPFKDDATDYICIAIEAVVVVTITVLILLKTNENVFSDGVKSAAGWFVLALDSAMVAVAIGWWGWRTIKKELLTACCLRQEGVMPIGNAAKLSGDHRHASDQQQPTAIHINKLQVKLEESAAKPEDIRSALMDEIRNHSGKPKLNDVEGQSDLSQKEEFVHWASDKQSDNSLEPAPLPELLIRQPKQPIN